MRKFFKQNRVGLVLLLAGVLFMGYGFHREEHLTVEKKSNLICLECIGIG